MEKDLRIVKTKIAIEKAFLSLIESNGYGNVKIIDIAKKAKINRNTIYLHYSSKEELMESMIAKRVYAALPDFEPVKYSKLRNNRIKVEQFFTVLLTLFRENTNLYRILLLDDAFIEFMRAEIRRIKKGVMPAFKQINKNSVGLDFILNGVFAILLNYNSYLKENVQENVKLLADFTMTNLRKLVYKV